jgi:hypothetical protein
MEIVLTARSNLSVGTFKPLIKVSLANYPTVAAVSMHFLVTVLKPNTAPYFVKPLPTQLTILKSEPTWTQILPDIKDDDDDDITITTDFGFAQSHVKVVDN